MATERTNPIICFDFDGVLHSYTSGWRGADIIPDPPVEGAIKFLIDLVKLDKYSVHIYSSRSNQEGGIEAMYEWLYIYLQEYYADKYRPISTSGAISNAESILKKIKFPVSKPPALVTIDDRVICFEGHFEGLMYQIQTFKPWNKKGV